MDEQERDYLRQQIHELERSKRRWKLATFSLTAALAIFLVLGAVSYFRFALKNMAGVQMLREEMMQVQQARAAEEAARLQAEQQLQQRERQAKQSDAGPRN